MNERCIVPGFLISRADAQARGRPRRQIARRAVVILMSKIVHEPRFASASDYPAVQPARVLRHDGDGESKARVGVFDFRQEGVFVNRNFRDADGVRRVPFVAAGERGRGGEPAGVSSHHFRNRDWGGAAHRLGVAPRAERRKRREPRRAAVAGAVVGHSQVVVDGLGDVHHAEIIADFPRGGLEAMPGGRRIVAADDEPSADAEPFKIVEHGGDVFIAQRSARRADCRARRVRNVPPRAFGHRRQVDRAPFQYPLQPARSAVQNAPRDRARMLGRQPVKTAVEHMRAAARLHD